MKTITLCLVLLCLCQRSLFAFVDPAVGDQAYPTNASAAGPLADQANEKLRLATTKADFEEVVRLLTNAASMDPSNLEVRKTLGWVYLDKLHEPRLAYPYLVTVVAGNPNDVDARRLLGDACTQTGRLDRALTEYREANRLKPDDLSIRANLGRCLARLGHYAEADKIYAEILRTDPTNAEARLGRAELAAWRGHSAGPLGTLQEVIKDNPTDADALILAGDIHRWNWDLAAARADYNQALQAAPDDYMAIEGLKAGDLQSDSSITLNGYEFKDTADFGRYSVGADTRFYLTDHAYLLAGGAGWRFTTPGFKNLYRADADAGIEYDWNRWLQTTLEGTGFAYDHHDAIPGGRATIKLSPLTGLDIYVIGAYHDPFVSSMSTVESAMRQDSVGIGLDAKLIGRFSFQNSLTVAHLSDENNWYEETPQLSFRLFSLPATYLRAQYDYLTYSDFHTNYWTPSNRHVATPILDTSIPLGTHVHIDIDGRMPFVFSEDRFGYQVGGGPTFDIASWMQFKISYLYAKIPGAINGIEVPWSGHGGQASLVFRF